MLDNNCSIISYLYLIHTDACTFYICPCGCENTSLASARWLPVSGWWWASEHVRQIHGGESSPCLSLKMSVFFFCNNMFCLCKMPADNGKSACSMRRAGRDTNTVAQPSCSCSLFLILRAMNWSQSQCEVLGDRNPARLCSNDVSIRKRSITKEMNPFYAHSCVSMKRESKGMRNTFTHKHKQSETRANRHITVKMCKCILMN